METSSLHRTDRSLDGPILTIDLAREIATLRAEAAWQNGDRNARTLFKDAPDLRMVLTVLRKGAILSKHSAPGPVTIQTVEGRGRIRSGGEDIVLPAGALVVLKRKMEHEVEALEDCALLITIPGQPMTRARE